MTDDIHRPSTSDRDPVDLSRWSRAWHKGHRVPLGRKQLQRRFLFTKTAARRRNFPEDGN
jgi:hypothetical protein